MGSVLTSLNKQNEEVVVSVHAIGEVMEDKIKRSRKEGSHPRKESKVIRNRNNYWKLESKAPT